jgi:hypothetical protein
MIHDDRADIAAEHNHLLTIFIDSLKRLHYDIPACPILVIVMTTSITEAKVLTVKQVADYLKFTERMIYRLAAGKKIPVYRAGPV